MAKPARTDPCPNCQMHHEPPACAHDPDRGCVLCGKPVGFRWNEAEGVIGGADGVCVFCVRGESRPLPRDVAPAPADEWLA